MIKPPWKAQTFHTQGFSLLYVTKRAVSVRPGRGQRDHGGRAGATRAILQHCNHLPSSYTGHSTGSDGINNNPEAFIIIHATNIFQNQQLEGFKL